jgi:hypothetical protein
MTLDRPQTIWSPPNAGVHLPGFYITSAIFFGIWWLLTSRLSRWSLEQDETGAAECTRKMRFHSGWGIVAFALTLTFSGVLWMKARQYQWFSAMYGVYFFSDCAWVGLATVYVIAALAAPGHPRPVLKQNYFYFIGVLLLRRSRCFRPTPSSRNTSSSGTPTCRRKPSGISSANAATGGA